LINILTKSLDTIIIRKYEVLLNKCNYIIMILIILFSPLIGFFIGVLLSNRLNKGVCFILVFNIFLSFLISTILLYTILLTGKSFVITTTFWVSIDFLKVNWCFLFDSLTSVMLVIITFISTLVHLYSLEYMEQDPHIFRFMSYLSLFTFFMIILVTANNLLQMFVGWEGVGLSSYLLINFWFTRIQANKSAIKAMLINRIGDFALLLAIFLIYVVFESLDYDTIFISVYNTIFYKAVIINYKFFTIDLICFFLFFGAMGKSAQLGLHTWLPDAMEGPTPVSALIHAATMVTAGIFLITRCSFLFEFSEISLNFISIIGSSTAFFASTVGLFQNDIKKVIAYSTCSQLGYMIFACGLSSYDVGVFHLSNHAFFKALLFLCAGAIIHAADDEQDMRKLGGLKNLLPFSYAAMLIGSLALTGFPFLTGFYSKDLILELAFARYSHIGHFCYFLGSCAACCTAFYSIRLIYLVFLSNPNGNRLILLNAHEPSLKMTLPLIILAIMSIFIGFLTKEFFVGFGCSFWGNVIFFNPINSTVFEVEFIKTIYKLLPLMLTILIFFIVYLLYTFYLDFFFFMKKTKKFQIVYHFLNKKWYFDRLYTQFVGQKLLNLSYFFSYQTIDRGVLEQFGPFGFTEFVQSTSNQTIKTQTGFLISYIYFLNVIIFISIAILLLFLKIQINLLVINIVYYILNLKKLIN